MIERIVLKIDGQEVSLTEACARQLHSDLSRLFGKQAAYAPWVYPYTYTTTTTDSLPQYGNLNPK